MTCHAVPRSELAPDAHNCRDTCLSPVRRTESDANRQLASPRCTVATDAVRMLHPDPGIATGRNFSPTDVV